MKNVIATIALAVVFACGAAGDVAAQTLEVGDMAPDFTLGASDGQTYTLSDLRGTHVVLAWFPKAFTGG